MGREAMPTSTNTIAYTNHNNLADSKLLKGGSRTTFINLLECHMQKLKTSRWCRSCNRRGPFHPRRTPMPNEPSSTKYQTNLESSRRNRSGNEPNDEVRTRPPLAAKRTQPYCPGSLRTKISEQAKYRLSVIKSAS